MITAELYRAVSDVVKTVADEEILSRFRRLKAGDVEEKQPGDLVTVADRRAEARLAEELERLLPGSTTVGEEAVEDDPTLLRRLKTDAPVWVVDPVDGTSNFAAGNPDYVCLVSLSTGDVTHASWFYAPSLGTSAGAHTGVGAWIDGRPAPSARRGGKRLDVATTHMARIDDPALVDKLDAADVIRSECRTAGLSYIDLALGRHDALVFTWEKPWDHAAGIHLNSCLGGVDVTADGTPFAVSGDNALPFAVGTKATVDAVWALLRD
ncbi:MAG: inositol monophosphatase family protein [Stackebrandtia sp.]